MVSFYMPAGRKFLRAAEVLASFGRRAFENGRDFLRGMHETMAKIDEKFFLRAVSSCDFSKIHGNAEKIEEI